MDHPSTIEPGSTERRSALPAVRVVMQGASATSSVSAGIAAVTAHPPKPPQTLPRVPGEDGGHSLAEMACTDLDAALQLLAERAQYITGASGAAIALRRGEHNDMLCRASAGPNAPELGALLSMEYGLSGESVRKRRAMRCDDAERDPRVNRESCRRLGIASVVVMPVVSDDQALGVFELFSGKPNAFNERDLSALQRLSEMIERAVKYAAAAQISALFPSASALDSQLSADAVAGEASRIAPTANIMSAGSASLSNESRSLPQVQGKEKRVQEPASPKKALFWSAAMRKLASSGPMDVAAEPLSVPPMLKHLQKCQACGFPVSQGRRLCVECEEKQWRGQTVPLSATGAGRQVPAESEVTAVSADSQRVPLLNESSSVQVSSRTEEVRVPQRARAAAAGSGMQSFISPAVASATISGHASDVSSSIPNDLPKNVAEDIYANVPSDNETPLLSSALESRSWFAANKFVLGALLVVAIVIAAIAWLR